MPTDNDAAVAMLETRTMLANARKKFRGNVSAIFDEMRQKADALEGAIGEVSDQQALEALQRETLEMFNRRL